jgi:hypothetical protein
MGKFFEELAKKLAERWVALLFMPGVLFVALAAVGVRLGQRDAVDVTDARRAISDLAAALARQPAGAQIALLTLTLLAAAGTGLFVQALVGVTRQIWLGQWPRIAVPLQDHVVRRRLRTWDSLLAQRRALEPQNLDGVDAIAARMNRISPSRPGRPTWMGDRMHAVDQIALNRSGLDLAFGWPRLWLVLPDAVRAQLNAAESSFAGAAATATWAVPYLILGLAWWPAAVIGAGIGISGWVRGRAAIADLSALSEAAIDLHGRTLATALGVETEKLAGPLTVPEGRQVTALVRKGR